MQRPGVGRHGHPVREGQVAGHLAHRAVRRDERDHPRAGLLHAELEPDAVHVDGAAPGRDDLVPRPVRHRPTDRRAVPAHRPVGARGALAARRTPPRAGRRAAGRYRTAATAPRRSPRSRRTRRPRRAAARPSRRTTADPRTSAATRPWRCRPSAPSGSGESAASLLSTSGILIGPSAPGAPAHPAVGARRAFSTSRRGSEPGSRSIRPGRATSSARSAPSAAAGRARRCRPGRRSR